MNLRALQALADVNLALSRELDLPRLLSQITSSVADLTGAYNVVLWQVDTAARRVVPRATSRHASIGDVAMPGFLAFGEGGTGWVAQHRQPLYADDVTTDPRIAAVDWAVANDLVSFAAVPLLAGDDLLGVRMLNLRRGHRLGEEDRALLAAFASQAAVAMRNAHLFFEVTRRSEMLRRVADLARSMSSALELESVLSQVTAAVVGVRPGIQCILRLVDREAGGYRLAGMGGAESGDRLRVLPFGQGLTHVVAETRRSLLVTDTRLDPRTAGGDWFTARGLTVFYGVPVEAGGALLGVLFANFPADAVPTAGEREAIDLFAGQAAVAIRNASLFAENDARRRVAETLADVGRTLARALDPDVVAHEIADRVRELFDALNSRLYRVDPVTGDLYLLAFAGGKAGGQPLATVPRGTLVVGLAAQQRRPVWTSNMLADSRITLEPEQRAVMEGLPHRAVLAVPLIHKDLVVGTMSIVDRAGRVFTSDEIRLAQAFASQAALALENARLHEQTQQRLAQVDSLREMIEQILVPFSLDERLTLVARKAVELSGADAAVVALLDATRGRLVLRAGHGLEEGELGQSLAVGEGAMGQAAARGGGVLVNDYAAWSERRPAAARRDQPPRAVMAYPLLIRGETIGVLSVIVARDATRFTPADLDRLASLAAPAALAIEHSRLYEQLERRLAELRDTQAQLVQAGKLSAVGQLVSGVAHELNNPLSVVIGYSQLLLRKELPPEMRTQLEAIVTQADRMAKIVQGLLLFSRQRPAERVRLDIATVLHQTLALRATHLRVSGIAVDVDCAPDLPPVIGDTSQLQQVFLNLVLNAEQAMTEAGEGDRIRLVGATRSEGGTRWVTGQVIDNGPGIPPDVLPRIFEPFFTTKTVGSGTGLGLSVSYGIVEQHGGTIDVRSQPGATTFTVALPAAPGGDDGGRATDGRPLAR